jgi:hypothetical protein
MLSAAHTWSLAAIAIAVSFLLLWAFGRFSNQPAITTAKRKIRAHLLAFRLFADEPRLIFQSQAQLLLWNLRYLALMLRPTAITILPLAFLLFQLDAVYGRRPLAAGESAIVTAQLPASSTSPLSLEGAGIAIETPPLRIPEQHSVSWRVRPTTETSGSLTLRLPDQTLTTTVQTGPRFAYLAGNTLDVQYPPADLNICGFAVHWLVWFSAITLVSMLLFRRRFHVTF